MLIAVAGAGAILAYFFLPLSSVVWRPEGEGAIDRGDRVSLEYTMSDDKGEVIESNAGGEPFVYVQGQSAWMIPALERSLVGLHAGDVKEVRLTPDEAYGPVQQEAFKEVPKKELPGDSWTVGMKIQARSSDGRSVPVRIAEVREESVVLDFNHPLAGKTLRFRVKILEVHRPDDQP